MEKLFVPYELAEKLKEKGFDEICFGFYNCISMSTQGKHTLKYFKENNLYNNSMFHPAQVCAPMYQQAVDWFRDKHDILISIEPTFAPKYKTRYSFMIHGANERSSSAHKDYINVTTENHCFKRFSTDKHPKWKTLPSFTGDYYEALDIAIKEALKLI